MKNYLFNLVLISALLLTSCRKEIQQDFAVENVEQKSYPRAAISSPNDPNLDPNWDFSNNNMTSVRLYYGSLLNNQPVNFVDADLPWYTMGNQVNFDKDYTPDLGWVLYLKDFGTPDRPAPVPYFALYNKYTGVLRFFVYNFKINHGFEQAKTYYIGELGMVRTGLYEGDREYNTSLFILAPPSESSDFATNPHNKQIVVSRRDVSTTWLNFDYHIGYDISSAGELHFQVRGASESDLNLATDFSNLTATSTVGTTTNNISNFGKAIDVGYQYFTGFDGLASALTKLIPEPKPKPESRVATYTNFYDTKTLIFSTSNVQSAIDRKATIIGTVTAAVGVVKGALGVIKTFIGGRNTTDKAQTTMHYAGVATTSGTSTLTVPLYNVQFTYSPDQAISPDRYVPLYKSGNFQNGIGLFSAPQLMYGGSRPAVLIIEEHNFGSGCRGGYSTFVDFKVPKIQITSGFDKEIERGNLKIESVNLTLLNNAYSDSKDVYNQSRASFDFLYGSFYSGSGSVKQLDPTDRQTRWVNNGVRSDNSSVANATVNRFYLLPWDSAPINELRSNRGRWPSIGMEVNYLITDPNYKGTDSSRSRVFYKVLDVSNIDYEITRYNGVAMGCPALPVRYPIPLY